MSLIAADFRGKKDCRVLPGWLVDLGRLCNFRGLTRLCRATSRRKLRRASAAKTMAGLVSALTTGMSPSSSSSHNNLFFSSLKEKRFPAYFSLSISSLLIVSLETLKPHSIWRQCSPQQKAKPNKQKLVEKRDGRNGSESIIDISIEHS